jgi:hypothetical protein
VDAVEAAMQATAKHEARSESLAALMVVARDLLEQARAAEAERARVAAEEAAAAVEAVAEAEAAVKRHKLVAELAALDLRTRQVQAELGSGSGTPQPDAEESQETMCVVCMDAAKDRAVRPCMHVCVCETCAQLLMLERTPRCPVCREPIQHVRVRIERVFF